MSVGRIVPYMAPGTSFFHQWSGLGFSSKGAVCRYWCWNDVQLIFYYIYRPIYEWVKSTLEIHCTNPLLHYQIHVYWMYQLSLYYSQLRNSRGITLQVSCCWSPTWSESRRPLLSRCWAPRAHWLSMSSAVIWTDWASQLSNKELSSGKDFDKPEGRGRDIRRERGGWREEEMDDIKAETVSRGGKVGDKNKGKNGEKEEKIDRWGVQHIFINKIKIQNTLY